MATRRPATQINARQKVLLANLQACGDEMSGQQLHRSLEPEQAMGPVSYTHLTLPTIYSV